MIQHSFYKLSIYFIFRLKIIYHNPIISFIIFFNTLAQNGTAYDKIPAVILIGNGSELRNTKALKGRAKRKMITQKMILSLIDVGNNKTLKDEQTKSYWNTYHCQNKVYTAMGRLYGKYCKNRYCTLCCSIRKAEIINKYLPVIQTWSEPYFVTLTAKAVPLKALNKRMKDMNRGFRKISSKYRKRNQRGEGIKLIGIKSLECNFNPVKKTYNPHFHLIVSTKEIADILINEWLKICTFKFARRAAQNSRLITDKARDLIEIIKYGSKIFTEPDVNRKSKGNASIHAAALDNIFRAMKGLRIFERFGFNLPKEKIKRTSKILVIQKFDEWMFDLKYFDWLNINNKKLLTDYTPSLQLQELLHNNIDILLQ